jgi:thymidylate synthase
MMKLLILIQGNYGRRIADHIKVKRPEGWVVDVWEVPVVTEAIIDEPEQYLQEYLPPVDLILHLAESPQAAQLLPAVVQRCGARGVIVSIDSSAWIPPGLRNQLRRELEQQGVTIVFPEPLCSIDEEKTGFYEINRHQYISEVISAFARHFGKPELELKIDPQGRIAEAAVKRGAPCGSTEYTAKRIIGMEAAKAVPTAGLMCLHYPCLASMQFEQTDNGVDTIMHTSGRVFNEAMEKALAAQRNCSHKPQKEGSGCKPSL